jgi:Cu-processing system permease protein
MPIPIMIRLTIREALRRKVILGLIVLDIVYLVMYSLGLAFMKSQMHVPRPLTVDDAYNFLSIAALYGANFLIVMLSVLISVDTIAGEISSGTIQSIAVKPIRRYQILLGKWLGLVIMLGASIALLGGGVLIVTLIITGHYVVPNALFGLAMMFLEALALLSVSLLGGTRLSTLANGVLGFGLFGLAFIGGWIQQIGDFINSAAAVTVGQIASLLMPSELLWRLALSRMSSGLNPFSFMFSLTTAPDPSIILYAIAFAAVILLIAMRSFAKRDL